MVVIGKGFIYNRNQDESQKDCNQINTQLIKSLAISYKIEKGPKKKKCTKDTFNKDSSVNK